MTSWRSLRACLPALNLSLGMNEVIYWKRNVDHVPELGVVMGVHEHVQPPQEEIRIRTHVDKVYSL